MKYSNHTLNDFLVDEAFRSWVINPDEESNFFWTSFIENNPDKYSTIIDAKEIILSLKPIDLEDDLDAEEVESLFEYILSPSVRSEESVQTKSKNKSHRIVTQFMKVAAIVIVTSAVGILWFVQGQKNDLETPTKFETVVKEALPGEKKTIRLPDNSVVVLNSNSRIEYPKPFINDDRRITLIGEAYFDIAKDESRPFIVLSDQYYTKVLGTSFVARREPNAMKLDVSVLEGKVEVGHVSDQKLIKKVELGAEEKVSIDLDGINIMPFDYLSQFAWKDGTLYFDKSDFNGLMVRLENWYGVHFEIKKSFDRKKDFSGVFRNENLDMVLNGIGFIYGFDYIIDGNTVVIQ